MNNIIKKDGFDFAFDVAGCNNCDGNCCIGESGYIWISSNEIIVLSKLLNLSEDELKNRYLYKVKYKYSIRERKLSKNNYACIFFDLDKKCCSIYEARPIQCRTFPFWDYFKKNIEEVKKECPAIKVL
jgi:Fe-S-cluster containining protein